MYMSIAYSARSPTWAGPASAATRQIRVQLRVIDRRFRREIYGLVNHGKYSEFLGVGTYLARRCSYESLRP